MLSFGESKKASMKDGDKQIGMYGIGCKSGCMRIAKDAIVFSQYDLKEMKNGKKVTLYSIAMLSQTYLGEIDAEEVIVPILVWRDTTGGNGAEAGLCDPDNAASLEVMLRHSPFGSISDLVTEIQKIQTQGVRIVLYNLGKLPDGKTERDIGSSSSGPYDIKSRTSVNRPGMQAPPKDETSLREYVSILFATKASLFVYLNGKIVRQKPLKYTLYRPCVAKYKPKIKVKGQKVEGTVTIGFNLEDRWSQGVNIYHRGRLIKRWYALEKIHNNTTGSQFSGIVAVLELTHLEPLQTKQDFHDSVEYQKVLTWTQTQIKQYMKSAKILTAHGGPGSGAFWQRLGFPQAGRYSKKEKFKFGAMAWARCPKCKKWRTCQTEHNGEMIPADPDALAAGWTCGRCNADHEFPTLKEIPKETGVSPTKKATAKDNPASKKRKRDVSKSTTKSQTKKNEVGTEEEELEKLRAYVADFEDRTPWEHVDPSMWTEEVRQNLQVCSTLKRMKHIIALFEASIVADAQESGWTERRNEWLNELKAATNAAALRVVFKVLPRTMKWYNQTTEPGDSTDEDDSNRQDVEEPEESEDPEESEESEESEEVDTSSEEDTAPRSKRARQKQTVTPSVAAEVSRLKDAQQHLGETKEALEEEASKWKRLWQEGQEALKKRDKLIEQQLVELEQLRNEAEYLRRAASKTTTSTLPERAHKDGSVKKIRLKLKVQGSEEVRETLLREISYKGLCDAIRNKLQLEVLSMVVTSAVGPDVAVANDRDVSELQQGDQLIIAPRVNAEDI